MNVSSGTGSLGQSRTKGRRTVVVVVVCVLLFTDRTAQSEHSQHVSSREQINGIFKATVHYLCHF